MAKRSPFPPRSLSDCAVIAKTILKENGGQPMKRLTMFDVMGKKPGSGSSRALITSSSGYGLTKGGYQAEFLSLTDRGRRVASGADVAASVEAVLSVEHFAAFYESYNQQALPADRAAVDFFVSRGLDEQDAQRCHKLAIASGKDFGIIQTLSGDERIVVPSIDDLPSSAGNAETSEVRMSDTATHDEPSDSAPLRPNEGTTRDALPSVHIDIQIHIAADAQAEQIDQVFRSMAKHLYGRRDD